MTVTLESLRAEHSRLGAMIAAFEAAQHEVRYIDIPEQHLELNPGEERAGVILGKGGEPDYHVILLPDEGTNLDWQRSIEWAKERGGDLPTRREQALLYANLKEHFQSAYYWSSEQPASDSACAWCQYFDHGNQSYSHKDYKLRARAVRRLVIE